MMHGQANIKRKQVPRQTKKILCSENFKRDRLGLNRRIILKTRFTETGYDIMECIHRAQDRDK